MNLEIEAYEGELRKLRQALSQPEQEPVAWMIEFENGEQELHFDEQTVGEYQTPLYTAPPKREWVGLTDTEKSELEDKYKHIETGLRHDADLIAETEAKLKEKNS